MEFLKNISLKDKSTFRIGGKALYYAEPQSQSDIITAIDFAQQKQLPIFVLGKGSNVLISDSGWPGLVINLSSSFCKITWNNDCVQAESGALLNTLINQVIDNSFSGMEELAGIPGTVGGAVIMNAGAFNTTLSDTLQSVCFYDCLQNQIVECNAADMELGYRTSRLKGKDAIVLSALFNFSKRCPKETLLSIRQEILQKRKLKQPLEYPNCGSVFKRPPGGFAGTLIEKCGLKGFRVGDVEVSTKHANFIVNRGEGTAADVRKLIKYIQVAVFDSFGIILEPEVIFIGDYDEPILEMDKV
jgi:UDP-N-acetylmuramate dehydrogenase